MKRSLNVLFLSPEVVPFAKSGGLADVAGALPQALAERGCSVTVGMPFYGDLLKGKFETLPAGGPTVTVPVGTESYTLSIRALEAPIGNVRHLFVQNAELYARAGLYGDAKGDYPDNDARFICFCRGILEWVKRTGWKPDIVHVNDWQSATAAAFLATIFADDPFFAETRSVLTIHNLAYQGLFPAERFANLGLDPGLFYPTSPFEFWGQVSFLKSGIAFAHKTNTVSPTYAREIQTAEMGAGLDGVLRDRAADLSGILNGMDGKDWSPTSDPLIAKTFTSGRIPSGKKANKEALCERAGLPKKRWERPLIGMISRLAEQKGFDLIEEAADELYEMDFNLVLLGTGEKRFHDLFAKLGKEYPDRLKVFLTFDNALAHQIEAGSDFFLMPSRYEPCGLNQMYSLAYATIPIVRATGGLADTVIDADADPGRGNGFVFDNYTPAAMLDAVERALAAYDQPKRLASLRKRAMAADFSWERSAQAYIDLYHAALSVDQRAFATHH
ncbi:MAG: glycogen synthase GlgA [Candidatus Zixiibacteriota bacterium]